MVDGAVADAALAHKAHDLLECGQILQRIAVHFNVGDMAAVRQRMIGCLDAELVKGRDRIIHRHMEAVRVILTVRYAGDHAEALGIHPDEAAGEALRRGGKAGEVQTAGRRLSVGTVADAADDLKSECLRLGAFAVVRAGQRLQALGKADEADGERAVLEHLAHLVVRAELFGVQPDALPHQEGEIAHAAAALDLEPLEQLADDKVEHLIKAAEKGLAVAACQNGEPRQIDGCEGKVAAPRRDLAGGIVGIRHHTRAAAHIGDLRFGMALFVILQVERGILEREVREQALGAAAAGQAEQVVVWLTLVEIHAVFHTEDLNGEDRRLTAAKPGLRSEQQAFHHKTALRRGIHAIVDGGKRRLRAGAGLHGVQIVDKRFHGLIRRAVRLLCGAAGGKFLRAADITLHAAEGSLELRRLGIVIGLLPGKRRNKSPFGQ